MAYRSYRGIFANMTRSILKKLSVAVALLLTGLLFAQFARSTPPAADADDRHFAEKVNLALRRTAHHLLAEGGNSTSRIAPVERLDAGTFLLRLEHSFDYDRLPLLLQESFRLHGIQANYNVAVLDCVEGNLMLGYNVRDLQTGNDLPCVGREQDRRCYNLQVTFATPETSPSRSIGWWILAGGFLLGGVSYATWQWAARKRAIPTVEAVRADSSAGLHFGSSSLDLANQMLLIGPVCHQLTYREAKLLHLFVSHPDQLLERDFILQSVWNDEGIIVGRSVDVFVSRLRKMLRDDPALRIVTVHGRGYRLETTSGVPAGSVADAV